MISSLSGTVQAIREEYLIVVVNGVGYHVQPTRAVTDTISHKGQHVDLFIYTHVRENSLDLYGFETLEERELFSVLLGVSGIGPQTALSVISAFSPEALRSIIAQESISSLTEIKGIGTKTAQRMMLDLKDRIGAPSQPMALGATPDADQDVISALTSLGYSTNEAHAALNAIPQDTESLDARIMAALQALAG